PYLKPIDDPDDARCPLYRWGLSVSYDDLGRALAVPGTVKAVRATPEDVQVDWAGADGGGGHATVQRTDFRAKLAAAVPPPPDPAKPATSAPPAAAAGAVVSASVPFRVLDSRGNVVVPVATGSWRVVPAAKGVQLLPPRDQAGAPGLTVLGVEPAAPSPGRP